MSGGFFRGTSADQDTRFSNKQAKLLKSQKFASELENLVDMTKVKMDVMKPWIAKRVIEIIGVEDEVLINFIYGLLEGKAVNGKHIQISITGFMGRNTGKFMKELWVLLLSAQQNVSGVPQQFLDAKEEESKNKKAETDRIANEIRIKKDKDNQQKTKTEDDGEISREKRAEINLKHNPVRPMDENEIPRRNGSRGRSRGSASSESASGSPPPRRKRSMSPRKSPNSRSYSERRQRQRSRSISRMPPSSRSISSERPRQFSPRRSVTPRRRHNIRKSPSLPARRSFYSKKRSVSPRRHRSPSPTGHKVRSMWRYRRSRSPMRHRSRSPMRRRSRTPMRRSPGRSPLRRRSPSPVRCRSPYPVRHRSPSTSHLKHSSQHLRSPAPVRRSYRRYSSSPERSASPVLRRSSTMHDQKKTPPVSRRSPSLYSSFPSPTRRSSVSPIRGGSPKNVAKSSLQSPGQRDRNHEKYSTAHHASSKDGTELIHKSNNGSKALESRPTVFLRSPQRDVLKQNDLRVKERDSSPYIQKAVSGSDGSRDRSHIGRRSSSPRGSPYRKREGIVHPESRSSLPKADGLKLLHESARLNINEEEKFTRRETGDHKNRSLGKVSPAPIQHKDSLDSADAGALAKLRKAQLANSYMQPDKMDTEDPDKQELSIINKASRLRGKGSESNVDLDKGLGGKGKGSHIDRERSNDKNRTQSDYKKGGNRLQELESLSKLSRKSEQNDSLESPSEKIDKHTTKVKETKKHNRDGQADSDDYLSSDSYKERREAKKRRKEEKKLKKQEKRQRREERRLRREGRCVEKLNSKAFDAGSSSSDLEGDHSEDDCIQRQDLRKSDLLETEFEQKKLEIELRNKALESLRSKKGIGN